MSSASDRAYQSIKTMILRAELVPGEQIREESLAEACGVSRTPVREALRRLETESLIRRNESQRSFVAEWSDDDVTEAFQLRGMLEGHAAKRAASRISAQQLAELRLTNVKLEQAIQGPSPNITEFLEQNRIFHAIITEAAGSARLTNMLTHIIERPVILRTAMQYDLDNLRRSHREHSELLAAFECRDGEWAEAIMAAHIRRAYHAYLDAHGRNQAVMSNSIAA
jgi:DNA-binding GntR family transcriptional regulator